jgi:hypothetical protein
MTATVTNLSTVIDFPNSSSMMSDLSSSSWIISVILLISYIFCCYALLPFFLLYPRFLIFCRTSILSGEFRLMFEYELLSPASFRAFR